MQNAPKSAPQNELQNEHQNERQNRISLIETVVAENERISINAIAERVNSTRITVRRDLKKLGYVWEGASKNGHWVAKSIFIFPISQKFLYTNTISTRGVYGE